MHRRQLGAVLRRLREAAGLTCEQVGQELEWSTSKVSRIEIGRSGVSAGDLRYLLDLYRVDDADTRDELLLLGRHGRKHGTSWWQSYSDVVGSRPFATLISLEPEAVEIRWFEPLYVPGLLQTLAYARAVVSAERPGDEPGEIDRRLALRMARQEALAGSPSPRLWVVLDEAVLHRSVGGPPVMREQLAHLAKLAGQRQVTIQVVPFSHGPYVGLGGMLGLLSFSEPGVPDCAYVEDLAGCAILERHEDLSRCKFIFNHLIANALGPDVSVAFIAKMAESII